MNNKEILSQWQAHRTALTELLAKVDNEHTFYEPWDGAMSLGHLAVHIVETTDMFIETVKQGTFTHSTLEASFQSMDDVRKIVRDATEKTRGDIEALTEEQLSTVISSPIMERSGAAYVEGALQHEIHHKGQLFTYSRLVGITDLPFFVKK
ncbi:DinB family protein [Aureibacillus halotolerans]|uniref:Putative damage-inducible protein DinB n=1 Tax=Aureibacillus halotolerans TaxID=1508390 RepID=A0A4R6TXU4_9BACI|nr:DinB family protein [Aureibacillus halotolerans]TDQ37193.1 putative damage-inducible protein DinB [Aureibacillus halotolerans]